MVLTTLLCSLLYEEKERSKGQRSVVSAVVCFYGLRAAVDRCRRAAAGRRPSGRPAKRWNGAHLRARRRGGRAPDQVRG